MSVLWHVLYGRNLTSWAQNLKNPQKAVQMLSVFLSSGPPTHLAELIALVSCQQRSGNSLAPPPGHLPNHRVPCLLRDSLPPGASCSWGCLYLVPERETGVPGSWLEFWGFGIFPSNIFSPWLNEEKINSQGYPEKGKWITRGQSEALVQEWKESH